MLAAARGLALEARLGKRVVLPLMAAEAATRKRGGARQTQAEAVVAQVLPAAQVRKPVAVAAEVARFKVARVDRAALRRQGRALQRVAAPTRAQSCSIPSGSRASTSSSRAKR